MVGGILSELWNKIKNFDPKQKIREYKSRRFYNSRAYYDVLTYDEENNRYILERHTIKERDAPTDALAVTDEKHHWFKTALEAPERVAVREDGHLNTSAVSNYLYLINNDINDALAAAWRGRGVDIKVLALIGAVVIGAVVWAVWSGAI